MYNIGGDLEKLDGAMHRTANSLERCEALLAIINKGYNILLGQLDSGTLNQADQLEVAAFAFFVLRRKDLLTERIEQLKSVHPSRIDSLGQVLRWDTEDSLLNWKRKT